ncbi:MAG: hypothetical protein COV35_02535 [Alphaproteobacteria bacterium CG11_big_fil_rev_8_21_14_0_20_39_49]|nr:MAG: hypothetical protein COV35_02535 [Alphaproteobacteria bacterium CG11_big_fil_rev_8_21_14_0_20_39_49]
MPYYLNSLSPLAFSISGKKPFKRFFEFLPEIQKTPPQSPTWSKERKPKNSNRKLTATCQSHMVQNGFSWVCMVNLHKNMGLVKHSLEKNLYISNIRQIIF